MNHDPADLQPYSPAPADMGGGYDPDRSWMPYTAEEHIASVFAKHPPVLLGGHVLYRHDLHGDVTDAIVLDIAYDSPPKAEINGLLVDLPPWPTLTLDTMHGRVRTRQARTRGSAGWLPLTFAHELVSA